MQNKETNVSVTAVAAAYEGINNAGRIVYAIPADDEPTRNADITFNADKIVYAIPADDEESNFKIENTDDELAFAKDSPTTPPTRTPEEQRKIDIELFNAVEKGEVAQAKELIMQGANPEYQDPVSKSITWRKLAYRIKEYNQGHESKQWAIDLIKFISTNSNFSQAAINELINNYRFGNNMNDAERKSLQDVIAEQRSKQLEALQKKGDAKTPEDICYLKKELDRCQPGVADSNYIINLLLCGSGTQGEYFSLITRILEVFKKTSEQTKEVLEATKLMQWVSDNYMLNKEDINKIQKALQSVSRISENGKFLQNILTQQLQKFVNKIGHYDAATHEEKQYMLKQLAYALCYNDFNNAKLFIDCGVPLSESLNHFMLLENLLDKNKFLSYLNATDTPANAMKLLQYASSAQTFSPLAIKKLEAAANWEIDLTPEIKKGFQDLIKEQKAKSNNNQISK